ncbi:MAG: hypothetical protein QM654_17700 [Dysgonamonadaceae bacterium]
MEKINIMKTTAVTPAQVRKDIEASIALLSLREPQLASRLHCSVARIFTEYEKTACNELYRELKQSFY